MNRQGQALFEKERCKPQRNHVFQCVLAGFTLLVVGCTERVPVEPTIESEAVSSEDVLRAAAIFAQEEPSIEDIFWLESFDETERETILDALPLPDPSMEIVDLEVRPYDHAKSALLSWDYEWIEKQNGTRRCGSTGFWNDQTGQCGNDWPPDKVYYFPCSNRPNQDRIRIYSTNWRVRWLLGSGVSARVFDSSVKICIGYGRLVLTGTNPYTLLHTTYLVW